MASPTYMLLDITWQNYTIEALPFLTVTFKDRIALSAKDECLEVLEAPPPPAGNPFLHLFDSSNVHLLSLLSWLQVNCKQSLHDLEMQWLTLVLVCFQGEADHEENTHGVRFPNGHHSGYSRIRFNNSLL